MLLSLWFSRLLNIAYFPFESFIYLYARPDIKTQLQCGLIKIYIIRTNSNLSSEQVQYLDDVDVDGTLDKSVTLKIPDSLLAIML